MKGYFITGTGTGVGKTFATVALAQLAREQGKTVFAFKPVETGCRRNAGGELVGEDQQRLYQATGGWQTDELGGVYRFELAAAPGVAAARAGSTIDLDHIREVLVEGASRVDFVLVEGAGGWRVPISEQYEMRDLASRCGLPVIVVGQAGLGTINHSLLTIESVEKTHHVAWLLLSQRPDDDPSLVASNLEEIAKRWTPRIRVLTSVPRATDLSDLIY